MKLFVTGFVLAATMTIAPVANAQVIFDLINNGDAISLYSNAANAAPTFIAGPPATLTRGDRALSHFASVDDIETLNGGSLAATDVIQLTWVVDNITGYDGSMDVGNMHNNNGIEFGVVSLNQFRGTDNLGTISRFRGDSLNVVNANRVGHGFGRIAVGQPEDQANPVGQTENDPTDEGGFNFEATEDSFADGFTVIQTISRNGVVTQYLDVVVTDQGGVDQGLTVLTTVIDPFQPGVIGSDADYVAFMNSAHFYAGASIADPVGGIVTFSAATMEINPNPPTGGMIPPSAFTTFRGTVISAALSDFLDSDDVAALYNPGFVINNTEAPVWLIFDGNGAGATGFQIESNAGTPGLEITFEAFNFNSAAFEVVGTMAEAFNMDQISTFSIVPADHVDTNGDVQSRVGWRQAGFVINFPWEVRVDQVFWTE